MNARTSKPTLNGNYRAKRTRKRGEERLAVDSDSNTPSSSGPSARFRFGLVWFGIHGVASFHSG